MARYVDVHTQAELDAALAAGDVPVCRGNGHFTASVTAYDSASVRAYGTASVTAYDSASVRAYGSASVTAFGTASVTAYGTASVTAYDSASVTAYGTASVTAYDSASVRASALVPVQDFGPRTKVKGGVVIPVRRPETAKDWCAYYGVVVSRGFATVFKAVDDDWRGSRKVDGVTYRPGDKPSAPDWQPTKECGQGLHFSPHAFMALTYCDKASRFVACKVKVTEMVVLDDKVKAPRCTVLYECDIDGNRVGAA